jgi:hypothetical protein
VSVPGDTPVTTPLALIVAIAVLDDAHTPDGVTSESVVALPAHTIVVLPDIADTTGRALIVTVVETAVTQPDPFITA